MPSLPIRLHSENSFLCFFAAQAIPVLRSSQRPTETTAVAFLIENLALVHRVRRCVECQRWFLRITEHQKYCGDNCRKRHAAHGEEFLEKRRRICAIIGKSKRPPTCRLRSSLKGGNICRSTSEEKSTGTSSHSTVRPIRESTRQTNQHTARDMESAHRTSLAKGEVGIREKKPVMTLAEFCDDRFEPWAKATFGKSSPKTWLDFYRVGLRAIRNYRSIASLRLDEITSERAAEFAAYRQSQGLQVSTVNSSLRVLRRMLRLAVEWGELQSAPTIKRLPGERHREHVVSYERRGPLSWRWV